MIVGKEIVEENITFQVWEDDKIIWVFWRYFNRLGLKKQLFEHNQMQ